ncbi:uncharacterized protein YndB with AHSA1/START domain [Rhodococcus sp. 27YEA15]|uniref:SRPBCC domain-containing protein n=1 Tax=Rhodococcus sp. 27YEA15 TaxID=3156259 RepID=UPI003C7A5237
MDNGTINLTYDGRVATSFRLATTHSPVQVWKVITAREYLDVWFPAEVDLDVRPGTELAFKATPRQIQRHGTDIRHLTHGTMISVHPHHILEYLWEGDTLHWELAPNGTGGCWLTFTHTVENEESAREHASGWHAGLEVVAAQLDDQAIDWSPWDRADELSAQYRISA